jgi:hypothetical protein
MKKAIKETLFVVGCSLFGFFPAFSLHNILHFAAATANEHRPTNNQ